jgi:tRNA pseudouridine55 synthase
MQTPPAHAALKYRGRAYYDYARAGEEIPREPRAIEVMRLALLEWRSPDAVLDVQCSKGTYVRVLAAELGERLGCGAHLAALRRTATGGFSDTHAIALDLLEALPSSERLAHLLPIDVLVAALPRLDTDAQGAAGFLHGQPIAAPPRVTGVHAVFGPRGLLGVAEAADGLAQPRRVFAAAPSADVQAA